MAGDCAIVPNLRALKTTKANATAKTDARLRRIAVEDLSEVVAVVVVLVLSLRGVALF